jgi:hypothetical protein
MQRAVEALRDIEKILAGLDAGKRRALRDTTPEFAGACAALEKGLREGGYLGP